MKKIYVLNVIGGLSKGGAEYQCSLLSNSLNKIQFKSKIMCFYKGPSPLNESLDNAIFISRGNKLDLFSLFNQIYSVIKQEKPDILHVWLPEIISVPATLIGRYFGIPVIASLRNSTKFSGNFLKYIRDRIRFIQYVFATKIISNFYINEEPSSLRILFNLKKGEVIFNGLRELKLIVEQKNKLAKESLSLLYVGRLAPEKNLPLLLRSLAIVKERVKSFKLRICGEGTDAYKSDLMKLINDLDISGQVEFLGYVKNWHLLAPSSLCLLLPSKSEGTANVVIESLNIGLPVIISNIPMSRSILKHEFNAIIVKQADPTVWAEKIIQLSKNKILTDRIKRNGIEYSKQFSHEKMVSKYEYSYKQLINYTNNDIDY